VHPELRCLDQILPRVEKRGSFTSLILRSPVRCHYPRSTSSLSYQVQQNFPSQNDQPNYKMNSPIKFLLLTLTIPAVFCCGFLEGKEQKTNVIFILADDLGWAQSGAYGSEYYRTPNIDRLAREGIRFTNAYAAAHVCSPTRASIMTGKHPARLHLTNFIPGNKKNDYPLMQPEMRQFLPLEEHTLGELFTEKGYITAMFGKWHLSPVKFGPLSLPYYPDKQGFAHHFVIDKPDSQANPELDPHWSDRIGDASVEFLKENTGKPFFLYISFSAIHDPLIEKAESIASWKKDPRSDKPENNPIIAAMLARLDRNVGKVLETLDETGLAENTMVVFTSDNGGLAKGNVVYYLDYYREGEAMRIAKQTPLREGKGWLYEGGIRVPLMIRWPNTIAKGLVSNEPVASYDFMPTFCEFLEADQPADMDGISLLPHLKTGDRLPERNLYWHFPHYHNGPPGAAVRSGKWKFIEWYEPSLLGNDEQAFELYDLENDIGESVNLAGEMQELTDRLAEDLGKWRVRVNAQLMTLNPGFSKTGGD